MRLNQHSWFDHAAYSFASHWLELPGARMHYVDEGSGPPVLLVHGTPGWSFDYRDLIRPLSKTHRCIAPDLIGFGLSDKPADWPYALESHTASLRTLLAQLGIARFDLVVHDFGGPVALPLALEDPGRVRRLVLANSWMWPLSIDAEFARRKRMVGTAFMRGMYLYANFSARVMVRMSWGRRRKLTPLRHKHFVAAFPNASSRHGTYGFLRSTIDRDDYLERLWARREQLASIPALVIWGRADRLITPVHLARWKEALPAARFEELADVGHFPLDEAPELLVPRVDWFLSAAKEDLGGLGGARTA